MANALSMPPPPDPNARPSGGNALMQTPGQPAPPRPSPSPPSHQQTVVALRHFGAIKRELTALLADPDLGKTSMKSAIIDGTTSLVTSGIMTARQAVTQLGTVPERPYDQKVWLEQHLATAVQGANMILDHHRAAFAGQPVEDTPPDPDNHTNAVAGLIANYRGGSNG